VYLFHDGKLTQVTRDHTLAQECIDIGLPIPCRSWHHKLTQCLGGPDREVQVEFHHFKLSDGDQLLLCTDGLSDMVYDDQISSILAQGTPTQETAHNLVERALERGGKDNVTIIVARYAL
jgi:protein phosphatase